MDIKWAPDSKIMFSGLENKIRNPWKTVRSTEVQDDGMFIDFKEAQ
jgi:hypothetical protein